MAIPTELIGSIPRPGYLLAGMADLAAGKLDDAGLDALSTRALTETISRLEASGSPVVSDGEQTKPSFATYPLTGVGALAPDGVVIPFADGHTRQLPRLTAGPFRYGSFAVSYLTKARKLADRPVKQAVIAPSALSLLYPGRRDRRLPEGGVPRRPGRPGRGRHPAVPGRRCRLRAAGLHRGQAVAQAGPVQGCAAQLHRAEQHCARRFTAAERTRIGVHVCPVGDQDSAHSLDADYAELLPDLFTLHAGTFYLQLASESDRPRVLRIINEHSRADQRIFVGVIPVERLGTCDDCGFTPFADDTSTSREIAFAKIDARVAGTRLAAEALGV